MALNCLDVRRRYPHLVKGTELGFTEHDIKNNDFSLVMTELSLNVRFFRTWMHLQGDLWTSKVQIWVISFMWLGQRLRTTFHWPQTCFFPVTNISASTGAGIQVIFHLGFFVCLFRSVVFSPYGLYPQKFAACVLFTSLLRFCKIWERLEYTSFRVNHYSSTC